MGGQPGDAIVTVHIGKHPQLRVDGRDLRLDLPVTLYEAVLGAKVEAPVRPGGGADPDVSETAGTRRWNKMRRMAADRLEGRG